MGLSQKQAILLDWFNKKKEATKNEIVEAFGDQWYQYNPSKHVGDVLTRMVDKGLLHRPKRGIYKLGPSHQHENTNPNQMGLFDN